MQVPDPRTRPTLDVEEAGALLGFGRSKSYEEAHRWLRTGGADGLPTLRFGKSLRCPTAAILAMLGLTVVASS